MNASIRATSTNKIVLVEAALIYVFGHPTCGPEKDRKNHCIPGYIEVYLSNTCISNE